MYTCVNYLYPQSNKIIHLKFYLSQIAQWLVHWNKRVRASCVQPAVLGNRGAIHELTTLWVLWTGDHVVEIMRLMIWHLCGSTIFGLRCLIKIIPICHQ